MSTPKHPPSDFIRFVKKYRPRTHAEVLARSDLLADPRFTDEVCKWHHISPLVSPTLSNYNNTIKNEVYAIWKAYQAAHPYSDGAPEAAATGYDVYRDVEEAYSDGARTPEGKRLGFDTDTNAYANRILDAAYCEIGHLHRQVIALTALIEKQRTSSGLAH